MENEIELQFVHDRRPLEYELLKGEPTCPDIRSPLVGLMREFYLGNPEFL
jgi:hypothetical protein